MKFYDVYYLYEIELIKGKGCRVYDKAGNEYLDFFGGHGVISIGHSHPLFLEKIKEQIEKLIFYSNSFQSSLKEEIAERLGKLSGYSDYNLFLCNSGAEAVENALKISSFYNGRGKVIAFKKSFHGRTTASISATDNPKIKAEINKSVITHFVDFDNPEELISKISTREYCAVIIEGIQGVGGINIPGKELLNTIREICNTTNTVFIIDEIQSGYGRTGKFFAHQHYDLKPDLITIAKGMANGIPAGGVLISSKFKAKKGMLGSTFGGNQLACTAGIAVLEIIENEKLIEKAKTTGEFLFKKLKIIQNIKEVRGRGLMIGLEFDFPVNELRNKLMNEYKIITGSSGDNIIRLLPPLCLKREDSEYFVNSLKSALDTNITD
jgi:acetylornithine aminotransferase